MQNGVRRKRRANARGDEQKPDMRHERRTSERMIAKSISIKGVSCKFGSCARKAVVLTSGDLSYVTKSRLKEARADLTVWQKSAASIVCAEQRVAQEGSSPSGARMRSTVFKSGGNSSLAGKSGRYGEA